MRANPSSLNALTWGSDGSPVVFLHGLFGQGRNWMTIGKALSDRHRVTALDLPHHGRSPWRDRVDYLDMAEEVAATLDPTDPVTVVGHSMGGKVAMTLALRHPELIERLVVADMSPVSYGESEEATTGGVLRYARMLRELDLSGTERRDEVDARLARLEPNSTIRAFLLQNLHRDPDAPDGWRWAANLAVLARDGATLAAWPEVRLADCAPFAGRVLWLAGERSSYVRPEYDEAMRHWFPHYRKVTIKQAGHWLHSEQPQVVIEVLRRFLGDA